MKRLYIVINVVFYFLSIFYFFYNLIYGQGESANKNSIDQGGGDFRHFVWGSCGKIPIAEWVHSTVGQVNIQSLSSQRMTGLKKICWALKSNGNLWIILCCKSVFSCHFKILRCFVHIMKMWPLNYIVFMIAIGDTGSSVIVQNVIFWMDLH